MKNQQKKTQAKKRGESKKLGVVDKGILVMARALVGLQEQSALALRPIVDEVCGDPETVDEKELEHVFDLVLDVSCCPKGKLLFNRLCKSFDQIYPDCVKDYIGFDHEMWGNEDEGLGRTNCQRE